eukprot:gene16455-22675_t
MSSGHTFRQISHVHRLIAITGRSGWLPAMHGGVSSTTQPMPTPAGSLHQHASITTNAFTTSGAPSGASATASASGSPGGAGIRWVFLGPPGVGKGTYASRMAKHFGADHIATGDLIRAEIKAGSAVGQQFDLVTEANEGASTEIALHGSVVLHLR